jgi:hypothetical protein
VNCKAHDVDNLDVVDGSFFCSSCAVNPALTIMANAIRVGDHLLERCDEEVYVPARTILRGVRRDEQFMTQETIRLGQAENSETPWRRWGPYLSERQWGTVREDYSASGAAWEYFSHDHARSRAYRWGEDGIAGISDDQQRLCLGLALWNGQDPILKERLFGLTNNEANHGEDVKELYYYLDATPTHSYLKMLYKYPHRQFPYAQLAEENRRRGKHDPEFELMDATVFDENRYFDVFVEYAKAGPEDILMQVTVCNRGPENALIHVLPQLWYRNTWSWGCGDRQPTLRATSENAALARHPSLGDYTLSADGARSLLFCDNETNSQRLWGVPQADGSYPKDAFHEYVVHGHSTAVNSERTGTKVAAHYILSEAQQAGARD